ncbi:MAG: hypothetical protein CVV64_14790 [Candidatus Wallbacteria bacterium HGW-Wallbacteria-1]|uniref:Fibronectin type-III domain-containing protein n=1 Tax=Candidatus Wallbacteria bacterium HGW-Wallbacteria-1 TaxID=2013854 RepID=A0A2N1PLV8_9BACT|nr:MAG: hypothetical protein CVV64_14790 [Candidatus Wallbacteria bacterium HGW-Wallbacteria-1]
MFKKTLIALLLVCFFSTASMALEVANLAVVNLTPVKATVFFTTDEPCQGKVIYQGQDKVDYLAMEEAIGKFHAVEVKGLNESSAYYFKLRLVDSEGKVLANLSNDDYAFTTPAHGLAMPSSIYGKVSGKTEVAVLVSVNGAESKSLPLMATPDKQGMWTVNLGDLKAANGKAMAAAQGDVIEITAISSDGIIKTDSAVADGTTLQKVNDVNF